MWQDTSVSKDLVALIFGVKIKATRSSEMLMYYLQGENGGSKVFQNIIDLPHNWTVSQPKNP
jgi:hypothetical protein